MVYRISGNWLIGVACDLHTVESIYLGVDEYGHNRFENTRSVIGELVYQLKYQNDQTTIPKIIDLLLQNIKGIESFDAIIPVPSSKIRRIQPVDAISKALGDKCKVPVLINYLGFVDKGR
ncbi:hypothetical protein [Zymomonas mobilis]|uniref:hypothetical protein n=1 Tax=Zymomonas mobilis TaxID=542 RepID=UPI0001A77A55|nr:hypothetical protein [Zymomonas mobilis]TQL26782.1 hypothetical protein FBY55_0058 [Zymomonas mobilis]